MSNIPTIPATATVLTAALAYVKAGLFVGPLLQGSKNPGSVLGSWPTRTSDSAGDVAAWFDGTDYGLFLHCGRSGLVVLDVDHPELIPAQWWPLLDAMPLQRSRPDADPHRGHYIAATPPGRVIGNAVGSARKGWGEVRGSNGVIVLAPTVHEAAAEGARYLWARSGPVPVLAPLIADTLPEGGDRQSCVSSEALTAWAGSHAAPGTHPELALAPIRDYLTRVEAGGSRHETAVRTAPWMCREIAAGLYPAGTLDTLEALFRGGFSDAEKRQGRGSIREWLGILTWAVAQVKPDDIAALRAKYPLAADELSDPLSGTAGKWDALWS